MLLNPSTLVLAKGPLDDRTIRYIQVVQPIFDDLRQAACTLAGLLVLAATNARASAVEHPTFHALAEAFRLADDALRGVTPSPAARHFHYHLCCGVVQLSTTIESVFAARLPGGDLGSSLTLLQASWQNIRSASAALPGFSLVDLDDSCCAMHLKSGLGRNSAYAA